MAVCLSDIDIDIERVGCFVLQKKKLFVAQIDDS